MTGELSNLKCEKAAPAEKPYSLFDGGGLYLWVTPSGGKLWRWGYHHDRKNKLMSFGRYPDVKLADARKHHGDARQLLANGVDPMAMRKETKEKKRVAMAESGAAQPVTLTFKVLGTKWFNDWKTNKDVDYVDDVEARLERDIYFKVGSRAPGDIKRVEWVGIIKAIEERGACDLARRALQNVKLIYSYGFDNPGLLDPDIADPVAGIRPGKILKPVDEEHFASLPIEEIPELLRRMRNYNGTALTRIALELIALTFLRTGELTGGLWREINWEEKRWNILKERMKGIKARKKPHIVPLSEQALVLLKQLHSITGKSDRMFPVATGGPGVISENTILQAIGHMGYKGRMTGHGWRSVASTYLNEHGFDSDHIEVQLAHCEGNDVKAAYNYAKYMVPRAAMMQAWADALDQLREQERTEFAA